MEKWKRGIPVLPGRYVCVVDDPHQGVVIMHHVLVNNHRDAVVVDDNRKYLIDKKNIRAYKSEIRKDQQ